MNSTYGIVRPSMVDVNKDVDIYYHYRPTRSSEDMSFRTFRKVDDVSSMLSNSSLSEAFDGTADNRLPGMYNLSLPVSLFGKKGIYTIYIKPREVFCTIRDVGALAAYPEQKGIVIDLNSVDDTSYFDDDTLVGYRVEYFDYETSNGLMRQDYYRIVTSNNKCEPVSQNLTSANTNSNGYRFNTSGTLCFLTLTPSSSPSFKANSKPYIGAPNQRIAITNTKFDPVMVEVEMTEHDIETLSIMTEGNVVRDLDRGRVTHYNWDNEIYKQFEFSTVKDNYTKRSVAEVKIDKSDNIDTSLDIEELTNV
ncbi:MAG: hypothetical protein J6Y37_08490 [Paludibacteraceae bacterium]|nr:hypothetical protein [Paludibacteraceae bacterium]